MQNHEGGRYGGGGGVERPLVGLSSPFSFFGAGAERKQWLVGWLVGLAFSHQKKAADSSAVCYPGVFPSFSARMTIRTALVGS